MFKLCTNTCWEHKWGNHHSSWESKQRFCWGRNFWTRSWRPSITHLGWVGVFVDPLFLTTPPSLSPNCLTPELLYTYLSQGSLSSTVTTPASSSRTSTSQWVMPRMYPSLRSWEFFRALHLNGLLSRWMWSPLWLIPGCQVVLLLTSRYFPEFSSATVSLLPWDLVLRLF